MQAQYTATRPTGPQAIHPPHLATDLGAIRIQADQLCVWVSLACLGFAVVQGLAYNNLAEALGWGVPLFSASYLLTRFFAGQTLTMYLNAALLVGMGALHVHVARGLLEFHFSFFMLLPVMLAYRDTRPLIGMGLMIVAHHIVFDMLQRAGFALPVADSFAKTVLYRDAAHLMRDLRAMGESNALQARLRRPTARGVLARAAALYAQNYSTPDGMIRATFEIICLTGWAPHETQQKPLRPGSAAARLADALNTAETPLPPTDS